MASRSARPGEIAVAASGTVLVIGGWLLAARIIGVQGGVPSPFAVVRTWFSDRSEIWSNSATTTGEAVLGYVIGNGLAVTAAMAAFLVRRLERTLVSIAVMSYCLPLVAVAPLLQVTLNGNVPEVALAALCVFFTTMLGVSAGLRSAQPTTLDVVRSLGGQRWTELRYVRAQSALGPALAALTLAAPLAVLGAILGEFIGGSSGLGVALVVAQKTGEPATAWAYCVTSLAIAALATLLIGLAARVLAPWHRETRRP